ncbi:MAG: hypothetical protein ACREWE_05270 [Gammaproteobacteria bacterium]
MPPEVAARLSTEDLDDIPAGYIPFGTVQAFEQAAVAREAEDLREHFEERAGTFEHDADLPRPEAGIEVAGSWRPAPPSPATSDPGYVPVGQSIRCSPRSLEVMEAVDKLKEYTRAVNDGDLSYAEPMLINQAHALEAMFD